MGLRFSIFKEKSDGGWLEFTDWWLNFLKATESYPPSCSGTFRVHKKSREDLLKQYGAELIEYNELQFENEEDAVYFFLKWG